MAKLERYEIHNNFASNEQLTEIVGENAKDIQDFIDSLKGKEWYTGSLVNIRKEKGSSEIHISIGLPKNSDEYDINYQKLTEGFPLEFKFKQTKRDAPFYKSAVFIVNKNVIDY